MQPKISIIIPIYNVEEYLRQCLDSAVNQTLRDIQIICVNDGSRDNSRIILQEYSDLDSRIEIIDKPNGGLSSARNAAYPYIKGKYTLFVDSDDWIELDLCEKVYRKAEESDAPVTVFFYQRHGGDDNLTVCHRIAADVKTTVQEKSSLLICLCLVQAWSKLWRTDFLIENNLYFPEDIVFEDIPVHWKGVVLAERIVVLPESLYHNRYRVGSITKSQGDHHIDIILVFALVRRFLDESGCYLLFKDQYHIQKLRALSLWYKRSAVELQLRFRKLIHANITHEDREYLSYGKVEKDLAKFYKIEIERNQIAIIKDHISNYCRLSEQLLRRYVIKPVKKRLKGVWG